MRTQQQNVPSTGYEYARCSPSRRHHPEEASREPYQRESKNWGGKVGGPIRQDDSALGRDNHVKDSGFRKLLQVNHTSKIRIFAYSFLAHQPSLPSTFPRKFQESEAFDKHSLVICLFWPYFIRRMGEKKNYSPGPTQDFGKTLKVKRALSGTSPPI